MSPRKLACLQWPCKEGLTDEMIPLALGREDSPSYRLRWERVFGIVCSWQAQVKTPCQPCSPLLRGLIVEQVLSESGSADATTHYRIACAGMASDLLDGCT